MTLAVELPNLPQTSRVHDGTGFYDSPYDPIACTDLRTIARHLFHSIGLTDEAARAIDDKLTTEDRCGYLALFASSEDAQAIPPANASLEFAISKLSPAQQTEVGLAVFSRISAIMENCRERGVKPTQDMLHNHGLTPGNQQISVSAIHARNTATRRSKDGFVPKRIPPAVPKAA